MTAEGFLKNTLRVCVLVQTVMLFGLNATNAQLRRSIIEDTEAMARARIALATCHDLLRRPPSETLRDGRPKGVVWRRFLPPKKLMD